MRVLAVVLLLAAAARASEPPAPSAPPPDAASRQGRWHFTFEGSPPVALSVLFTRSDSGDATRHLVESGEGRFDFFSRQDPTGRDSTESVRSLVRHETLTRRMLLSGYQGVRGCEDVKPPDACLVFEGKGGRLALGLSQLSGPQAEAHRAKLRALLSEAMQRELVALSPAFTKSIEFTFYSGDFLGLLWPSSFEVKNTTGVRRPGCSFDAAFGYPCSEVELHREAVRFRERNPLQGAPTPPRPAP